MKRILSLLLCTTLMISCNEKQEIKAEPVIAKISSKYSCAPQVSDMSWYGSNRKAPLFEGLDAVNYPISTKSELAQKYFNQGFVLAYGFNHAEAARSFYYATKLDPDCSMCYWGFAYVLGPNYNAGMEDDNYERAYEAIQKAMELSVQSTDKEKDLILATSKRYSKIPPEDRYSLDVDYSDALREVQQKYPDDPQIKTLFIESVMNLHKWDLQDKKGNDKPWTPEIISGLEEVLAMDSLNPGAHHFYIHAVEASSTPERALPSARVFDQGLVAGSGHLLHMPSHVYIRTGDYNAGTLSNIRAVAADSAYVTLCHAQGAYPLAYYPHNYHFMAATATLEGNTKYALEGAIKVSEHVYPDLMKEAGWGTLQHYYLIPYYVLVKLGEWDSILELQMDTHSLPYPEAIRLYAEGMAHMGKGEPDMARKLLSQLMSFENDPALEEVSIWDINTVQPLVQIAVRVLKSEILIEEKNYGEAVKLLNEAVAIEDKLNYDEPPDWFFSVRHQLGNALIEAGQFEEAIAVYEEDLVRLPKNGWAYHGMLKAYENLNDRENQDRISNLIRKHWTTADITLDGSVVRN